MSAPDFSHGLEALAGLINFRVGAWHDFGYEVPPAPECKPVPPLGERSAEAINAGHEAVKSIDELTRQLYQLREQLTGELRQDEDVRADRVDAMLARRRQERQAGATVPADEDTGLSPELVAPVGVLPWILADDRSHWRTELPDGRTAVIRRVLGEAGESSLLFVPAVYETASDFVTGPECNGVLAAALGQRAGDPVNRIIAVLVGLLFAIHVSVPAMDMPAPVPVFLAFAGVIWTLLFMIGGPIRRDGLFPVWLRVTA